MADDSGFTNGTRTGFGMLSYLVPVFAELATSSFCSVRQHLIGKSCEFQFKIDKFFQSNDRLSRVTRKNTPIFRFFITLFKVIWIHLAPQLASIRVFLGYFFFTIKFLLVPLHIFASFISLFFSKNASHMKATLAGYFHLFTQTTSKPK